MHPHVFYSFPAFLLAVKQLAGIVPQIPRTWRRTAKAPNRIQMVLRVHTSSATLPQMQSVGVVTTPTDCICGRVALEVWTRKTICIRFGAFAVRLQVLGI